MSIGQIQTSPSFTNKVWLWHCHTQSCILSVAISIEEHSWIVLTMTIWSVNLEHFLSGLLKKMFIIPCSGGFLKNFKSFTSSHWLPDNVVLLTAQGDKTFSAHEIPPAVQPACVFWPLESTSHSKQGLLCSNKTALLKKSQIITLISLWHIPQSP